MSPLRIIKTFTSIKLPDFSDGNIFEVVPNNLGNIRLRDHVSIPVTACGRFPDSNQTPMPKDRIVCLREDPEDDDTTDANILFQAVQVGKKCDGPSLSIQQLLCRKPTDPP